MTPRSPNPKFPSTFQIYIKNNSFKALGECSSKSCGGLLYEGFGGLVVVLKGVGGLVVVSSWSYKVLVWAVGGRNADAPLQQNARLEPGWKVSIRAPSEHFAAEGHPNEASLGCPSAAKCSHGARMETCHPGSKRANGA